MTMARPRAAAPIRRPTIGLAMVSSGERRTARPQLPTRS